MPILRSRFPTSADPVAPLNVGPVTSAVPPRPSGDVTVECNTATRNFNIACGCSVETDFVCPPRPEQTVCDTLASERDLACTPPPSEGNSVHVNQCLANQGLSGQPSRFVSDIGGFYPGASFASGSPFCGLETDTEDPAENCAGALRTVAGGGVVSSGADSDGDGVVNRADLCPAIAAESGGHLDADGDGAGDVCDPNRNHRDLWVGPGFSGLNLRGYANGPGFTSDARKIGWVDTDQDGLLNGADICPSTPGDIPGENGNFNAWGEEASFPGSNEPAFLAYANATDRLLPFPRDAPRERARRRLFPRQAQSRLRDARHTLRSVRSFAHQRRHDGRIGQWRQ